MHVGNTLAKQSSSISTLIHPVSLCHFTPSLNSCTITCPQLSIHLLDLNLWFHSDRQACYQLGQFHLSIFLTTRTQAVQAYLNSAVLVYSSIIPSITYTIHTHHHMKPYISELSWFQMSSGDPVSLPPHTHSTNTVFTPLSIHWFFQFHRYLPSLDFSILYLKLTLRAWCHPHGLS